jgi:hypothetical protein
MVALAEDVGDRLRALYDKAGDVPPESLAAVAGRDADDDTIAEVIDADGRIRIERGLSVDLARYLTAVPDLGNRPVALDAAIEFSLRAAAGDDRPESRAVAALIAQYPQFEQAIRAASLLSQALWSTTQVRESETDPGLRVPSDFGPLLTSGEPRYEIRGMLGRGAQGTVYRAADRLLGDGVKPAWVAIKVLRRQVGDGTRGRFLEEAGRARRIEHPNTVRVLDRGVTEDGRDYIVSEFVEGPTLREFVQAADEPMPPREAAALAAAIARGVQAAHAVGVVHCDLKPDNILVTADRQPKITDFGLAVGLEDHDARNPDRGGPLGNLGFIAPEQHRMEEGAYAPAADIYACGGILYYLLTRQLPNGQSVEEVERNLDPTEGRSGPPDPRTVRPKIDRDLAAICMRALAMRPVDRYGSAESFAADLDAWLRHEPIAWTRPGPWRRSRLFFRRQPGAVVMLAVAMVLVGIASGVGVGMGYRAEQKVLRSTAALAQQRARDLEALHAQRRATASLILGVAKPRSDESLANNWLPVLTILEGLLGPELFGPESGPERIWQNRIEAVRKLATESRDAQKAPHLEELLWQTYLGFLLMRADQVDEAENVLNANRAALVSILSPDDRYIAEIDAILACGVIKKAEFMSKEDRSRPEVMEGVERAADLLAGHEQLFRGRRFGNAIHKMIVESLLVACEPGMLDRPELKRRMIETQRRILEGMR